MGEPIYLSPTELADRLQVARERLEVSIREEPVNGIYKLVFLELLIDGKDLTPEQERVAEAFIKEKLGTHRPQPIGSC